MVKIHVEVADLRWPERLDTYLARHWKDRYSREAVKRSIRKGWVRVNGEIPKPSRRVQAGDRIEAEMLAPDESRPVPEEVPLRILHEDEDLIVVDKPAGMVVHPGAGHRFGTVVNALLGRGSALSDAGADASRPGIVHRLDKETSGLLVVAKTNSAHRLLQAQFSDRSFSKTYLAIVKGRVEFEEGRVNEPIGRHPKLRRKMALSRADSGRAAETRYRVLKRFKHASLLEVKPVTGRTHQIRVHMAHIGHPVIGDELYGTRGGFKRHALHAAKIQFRHPRSGKLVQFEALPPEDFNQILKKVETES